MRLKRLLPLALDVAEEHMLIPLDKNSPDYALEARIRAATAQMIVQAQIKVDDQQFRQAQASKIPELLERLKREEARAEMKVISPPAE